MVFYLAHAAIIALFFLLWFLVAPREKGSNFLTKYTNREFIVRLILLAFVMRLVGMLVLMIFFPEWFNRLSAPFPNRDDLTYYEDATALASIWHGHYLATSWKLSLSHIGYFAYPYLLAAIYYLTYPSYVIGVLINNIFGVLTCVLTYFLGREYLAEDVAREGALLLAIYPADIYFCSFTLKDPLMILLLMAATYCGLKVFKGEKSFLFLTAFFISIGAMLFIRIQMFLLLFALFLVGFSLTNFKKLLKVLPLIGVLTLAIVLFYNIVSIFNIESFASGNFIQYYRTFSAMRMHEMRAIHTGSELYRHAALILGVFGYFLPLATVKPMAQYSDYGFQVASSIFIWNIIAGFSVVGLLLIRKKGWRATWWLWAPLVAIFLGTALLAPDTVIDFRRGKLMLAPFACLLAAVARREWRSFWRPLWIGFYIVAVIVGSVAYTYLRLKGRGMTF
jgi:hypothetical protein